MDASWIKIRNLYTTHAFAKDKEKIEDIRKMWASMLREFNVDFQFAVENKKQTYELNLYVRRIDELKVLQFIENFEDSQTYENSEELENFEPFEQIEESNEENITNEENIKNEEEPIYQATDMNGIAIIFGIFSLTFVLIAVMYGIQIVEKIQNNSLENVIENSFYVIIFVIIAIVGLIATIIFHKKAKELKENGDE